MKKHGSGRTDIQMEKVEMQRMKKYREDQRNAMMKRLANRDAAYEAEFPECSSGDRRGSRFAGCFGRRCDTYRPLT